MSRVVLPVRERRRVGIVQAASTYSKTPYTRQAYATRYEFSQQRNALGGINARMQNVISKSQRIEPA